MGCFNNNQRQRIVWKAKNDKEEGSNWWPRQTQVSLKINDNIPSLLLNKFSVEGEMCPLLLCSSSQYVSKSLQLLSIIWDQVLGTFHSHLASRNIKQQFHNFRPSLPPSHSVYASLIFNHLDPVSRISLHLLLRLLHSAASKYTAITSFLFRVDISGYISYSCFSSWYVYIINIKFQAYWVDIHDF